MVGIKEIAPRTLAAQIAAGEAVVLVDVRQPWEHELVRLPASTLLPLDQLPARAAELAAAPAATVVVYCHHGVRSLSGAAILTRLLGRPVLSLAGGIDRWSTEIDPTLPRY